MDQIPISQPPILPQPPPAPVPPKTSRQVLLIVGFVLFLSGLGGGLILSRYLPSPKPKIESKMQIAELPTPSSTSTSDPMAYWKTYSNSQYGFSFKYPMNFDSTCCGISGPILGKADMTIVLADPATGAQGTDKPFNGLGIYIDSIVDFTSAEGFASYMYGQKASLIKNYKDFMDKEPINNKSEFVTVAGVRGEALVGLAWWLNKIVYVPFPDNKKVLVIVKTDASKGSFDTIFDQILSTFKFTDQKQINDMIDWKLYANKKLGFSVELPPNEIVSESASDSDWIWMRLENLGLIIANSPPAIGDPFFKKEIKRQIIQLSNGISLTLILSQRGNSSFEKDGFSGMDELFIDKNPSFTSRYYINAKFPHVQSETNFSLITQILSTFKFLN